MLKHMPPAINQPKPLQINYIMISFYISDFQTKYTTTKEESLRTTYFLGFNKFAIFSTPEQLPTTHKGMVNANGSTEPSFPCFVPYQNPTSPTGRTTLTKSFMPTTALKLRSPVILHSSFCLVVIPAFLWIYYSTSIHHFILKVIHSMHPTGSVL